MTQSTRTVLVSGAGGAIGVEVCRRLAATGARVVGADISARRLGAIEEQVGSERIRTVRCDVRTEDGAAEAVNAVLDHAGGERGVLGVANVVGGIVGDVASFYDKPIEEMDFAEFTGVFDLNVHPTFLVTRGMVPAMRAAGGGTVVNVASMAYRGTHDLMGNVAYDAAKAGVVAMTSSLARTLGPSGIRVNAVAPGLTLGPGLAEKLPVGMVDHHLAATPLRKVGTPEEVAAVVVFLLGDDSAHVTGQAVHVGGGLQ